MQQKKYGNTILLGEPIWISMGAGSIGIGMTMNKEGKKTLRAGIVSGVHVEKDEAIIAEWGGKVNVDQLLRLLEASEDVNTGPTGEFPQGKIADDDDGELAVGIAKLPSGKIVLNFGTPVKWVGFDKDSARQLGTKLLQLSEDD